MDELGFFSHDEAYLKDYLEKTAGVKVRLTITDNSSRMLSVRMKDGVASVRLHRIFLNAGAEVLREAAGFMTKRRATPAINGFLRQMSGSIARRPPDGKRLKARGSHYDLKAIYDRLNDEYFGGEVDALITWAAGARRRSVRVRTLGSYGRLTGTIRISPLLDSREVPLYLVSFIVYHEMLHASLGVHPGPGRRRIHCPVFKTRERLFNDYEKASLWMKKNRL